MVGKYCGDRTGQNILSNGDQIVIKFHSDNIIQQTGYLIHFTAGLHGKYFSQFLICYVIKMATEYPVTLNNC